jgi:hypothetical protein
LLGVLVLSGLLPLEFHSLKLRDSIICMAACPSSCGIPALLYGVSTMTPAQRTGSLFVLFSRFFWMMCGPMMLGLLAFTIISVGRGWFTPADFGFLAVLCVLPLARWIEFRGGDPRTATGEPASPRDLRRYALGAIVLGFGVWVVANLFGIYWLPR